MWPTQPRFLCNIWPSNASCLLCFYRFSFRSPLPPTTRWRHRLLILISRDFQRPSSEIRLCLTTDVWWFFRAATEGRAETPCSLSQPGGDREARLEEWKNVQIRRCSSGVTTVFSCFTEWCDLSSKVGGKGLFWRKIIIKKISFFLYLLDTLLSKRTQYFCFNILCFYLNTGLFRLKGTTKTRLILRNHNTWRRKTTT